MVQLSHLSLTTGKIIALIIWVFVGKVMFLHGTTDWFQIGKGVRQGCVLSPCLFNFYAEYSMKNAGLEETQTGIKIAGRNINNLIYADDTTLWQKVKRNSKAS